MGGWGGLTCDAQDADVTGCRRDAASPPSSASSSSRLGHRLRRAPRSRKQRSPGGGTRSETSAALGAARSSARLYAPRMPECLPSLLVIRFAPRAAVDAAAAAAAATSPPEVPRLPTLRSALLSSPLLPAAASKQAGSRQAGGQADRRAARPYWCAPAVHAWHGRADARIHLSS